MMSWMSCLILHTLFSVILQAGWRKFWSKREQRPYFFNKLTNESMWDMPTITPTSPGGLTDPLGIQAAEHGKGVTTPTTPLPGGAQVGEKRRASQDLMLSPTKKMAFNYKLVFV